MKKHYDIGVSGCWFGSNYGSLLNGYATYKLLKSFGLEVLMINKPEVNEQTDWELANTHNSRFIKKFYDKEDVSPSLSYAQLSDLNYICDMFCSGSDQIWNYNINQKFRMSFMLNFASNNKRLISFATSFGHIRDKTPSEMQLETNRLINRYSAISIREKSGVDICKNSYGVRATQVIDPVFCIDKEYYYNMANDSSFLEEEPYLLTYILDPTLEKREAILFYSKEIGVKAINILDGFPFRWEENNQNLDLPNTLKNVHAEDFVKAFIGAQYIITDSFHGTAFAAIFNKPFLAIGNYGRGYERFTDLLGRLKLADRLVNPKNIPHDVKYLKDIDYTETNKNIEIARNYATDWLKHAVETKENLSPVRYPDKAVSAPNIWNAIKCSGCGACQNVCPINIISLEPDELGYYRPQIDIEKCTNCGLCAKTCPAIHLPEKKNTTNPKLYAFVCADKELLFKSSSGGAFPLMAKQTFLRGGVVAGAAWKDDFSVEHILVDNWVDLSKLQKSKYLQSYIGNIFRDVKRKLEDGIFVCFSGCPCQVAGLQAYLGKEYDNLIMIDLLCGNSPSTMFFQKYLADSFEKDGVSEYEFRHKAAGWNATCLKVVTTKGETQIRRGGAQDEFQSVYHNHTMCAPHCENCQYQSLPRYGDITIGDFWGIANTDPTIESKNGVSAILVNNTKGAKFLAEIPAEDIAVFKEEPLRILGGNGYAYSGHNFASSKRDVFYNSIKQHSFGEALQAIADTPIQLPLKHSIPGEVLTEEKLMPLTFFSSRTHFIFDRNCFQEHYVKGLSVLTVFPDQDKAGVRAFLPLNGYLNMEKQYQISARFKIKTETKGINFHLFNSERNIFQVIKTVPVTQQDDFITFSHVFTPNSKNYDQLMIGACHIKGKDAYLALDYITVSEKK